MAAHFDKDWTFEDIMELGKAPKRMMFPLRMHYFYLWMALITLTAGAFCDLVWDIGGPWTTRTLIFSIALLTRENAQGIFLLLVVGFSAGCSAAFLLGLFLPVDRCFMVRGFGGYAVAPAWFLLIALITRCRCCLYFWATFCSAFAIVVWLDVTSIIFGTVTIQKYVDYLIFYALFLVYMVVYNQQMIYEARNGNGNIDYVRAPLIFFTDFCAIFFRLLDLIVMTFLMR